MKAAYTTKVFGKRNWGFEMFKTKKKESFINRARKESRWTYVSPEFKENRQKCSSF